MTSNIGPQTIKSICKSAAWGESVERTAAEHNVSAEDVKKIWEEHAGKITDYKAFYKTMAEAEAKEE